MTGLLGVLLVVALVGWAYAYQSALQAHALAQKCLDQSKMLLEDVEYLQEKLQRQIQEALQ